MRGDDAVTLQAVARRLTGLARPFDEPVGEALSTLLASLRREARLSAMGRIATRQDLIGKLTNLLILDDLERADPSIRHRPIGAPVFVTGLPRSGTSFLHALLATHTAVRAPLAWQTRFPAPSHPAAGLRSAQAAHDRFARQLRLFGRLAPELPRLHPMSADAPQECTEITAHVFRSLRFDMTHDVPSYRAWLDRAGHDAAYRFHRRFLQHLQGTDDATWVLKSPDHVFALRSLRLVYPDARLVVMHRDPVHVLASVARLTEVVRRPFARAVDRLAIGRQVTRDWALGLRTILDLPDEGCVHIRHADLVGDPVGTVAALCGRLGIGMDRTDRSRMELFVAQRPRGGYGINRYTSADYGFGPESLEPWRSAYGARFGV